MSKYTETKDKVRYYEEEAGYTDILVVKPNKINTTVIDGIEYIKVRVYNNKG